MAFSCQNEDWTVMGNGRWSSFTVKERNDIYDALCDAAVRGNVAHFNRCANLMIEIYDDRKRQGRTGRQAPRAKSKRTPKPRR